MYMVMMLYVCVDSIVLFVTLFPVIIYSLPLPIYNFYKRYLQSQIILLTC